MRDRERERERENRRNETTEPFHLFSLEHGMPLDINQILRHEDMGEFFDKFVEFTLTDRYCCKCYL